MIAVVGAGLAGVTAARALVSAGRAVTLFDKSPRVGGRLATRTGEDTHGKPVRFDHGCQHLCAAGEPFAGVLRDWHAAGVVTPRTDGPGFVAPGGMRSVVEHFAANLNFETGVKVSRVTPHSAGWTLAFEGARPAVECDWLVLTPPVPQTLDLLFHSGVGLPRELLLRLREVEYTRCLTVLAAGPGRVGASGLVDTAVDNHAKGVSPTGPAWTVQFTPAASENDWEASADVLAWAAFGRAVPGAQVHRWKYGRPVNPVAESAACVPELRLVLAGDGFGPGGSAESAHRSGLAAAALLLGAG